MMIKRDICLLVLVLMTSVESNLRNKEKEQAQRHGSEPICELGVACNGEKIISSITLPIRGAKGPQGEHGQKGNAGHSGEPGLYGLPGQTGSIGRSGQKGDAGHSGVPGRPGLTGEQGLDGISGQPGLIGLPGLAGLDGRPAPSVPRVAFFAGLQNQQGPIEVDSDLVFDKIVTNVGNVFNPDTGRFTATHNGTYQFNVAVGAQVKKMAAVNLVRNGEFIARIWAEYITKWSAGSNSVILDLIGGDQVWLVVLSRAPYLYGNMYTAFSGHLLFPAKE